MKTAEIGGNKHPYAFGWVVFERVSKQFGHNSPDTTANNLTGLIGMMPFARVVAFEAIRFGYESLGEACPFEDSEALAVNIVKFGEISSIIQEYTAELLAFYDVGEEVKPSKKKAVKS